MSQDETILRLQGENEALRGQLIEVREMLDDATSDAKKWRRLRKLWLAEAELDDQQEIEARAANVTADPSQGKPADEVFTRLLNGVGR